MARRRSPCMSHLALLFVVALGLGLPSLSLAKQQANSADGVPMTGVWESNEQGVKLLLKHVQNCTAASEAEELDPCLVFLLYSTSCPFSREMYTTIEGLSHQYNRSVAFVAMDNALSSLNFLMQFGFHAVPQVLIHSPLGKEKLRGSETQVALNESLKKLQINPNVSCNLEAFKDILPNITWESKPAPTDWTDGSQEMAKMTWAIVAILAIVYALPKLYKLCYKEHSE